MVVLLKDEMPFPDPRGADPEGLVAVGGDLSMDRLLSAYRNGIFPWTVKPVTWWSPDPRGVMELDRFHVSKSLGKTLKKGLFRITRDRAFKEVMEGCAEAAPGRRTTWITPEFINAYTRLHERGYAHSLECWQERKLVGGIYGVAMGGFFAGESMFRRANDASKVALYYLTEHLQNRGFTLFDIQTITPTTKHLGGISISREDYLKRLAQSVVQDCTF
ncbi:leucyl/phenylalanyl-tRNA--protein transferase [Pedosphaera parvula]|uniref:Leucyl/phenylalanyl-tRNA--protein transferase n=1 Tax=Pedosphaera parvula (strain Ellin514) TaxID=320771 RepID=B9XH84_PEDPL|nr:leucyl/phenylalanyl-tRNA--protein transferase [Pedosphaera parvula]EEF60719.1 leucyl/phenylalanyl-tRNA/protein transferase [Pedosphaera parvula Ellin514]